MTDELLISHISNCPALWQKTCSQYRDVAFKENCWITIANALRTDVTQCQQRWKSMRERYAREIRLKKIYEAGNKSSNYTSRWPYMEVMNFLTEHIRPRHRFSNGFRPTNHTSESNESNFTIDNMDIVNFKFHDVNDTNDDSDSEIMYENSLKQEHVEPELHVLQGFSASVSPTISKKNTNKSSKKNIRSNEDSPVDNLETLGSNLLRITRKMEVFINENQTKKTSDEVFGEMVGRMLKEMDPDNKKEAKRFILDKLLELE